MLPSAKLEIIKFSETEHKIDFINKTPAISIALIRGIQHSSPI